MIDANTLLDKIILSHCKGHKIKYIAVKPDFIALLEQGEYYTKNDYSLQMYFMGIPVFVNNNISKPFSIVIY